MYSPLCGYFQDLKTLWQGHVLPSHPSLLAVVKLKIEQRLEISIATSTPVKHKREREEEEREGEPEKKVQKTTDE